MNKHLVTIVALSVDTRHATLYLSNGETMNIAQGDARLPKIVEVAKPELDLGFPVTVDVTPIYAQRTEFEAAEKGTKGVVKFFRVAKSFLKKLIDTESPVAVPEEVAHVSPLSIGIFPNQGTKEESEAPQEVVPDPVKASPIVLSEEESKRFDAALSAPSVANDALKEAMGEFRKTNDQKLDAAAARLQQLAGNSKTTADPEFHTEMDEEKETIVAVHETSGMIVPDAHKLARQLRAAEKLQDYTGFSKFMERLSLIIQDRTHSVEDLMKFIEKGDLPIADDGCIVIYKRLNRYGDDKFVDVHSGQIIQKVGSYVFMRAGLVDPDRRQDCSNGLHVGSLSYMGGFSGNVTVIAKVRPEDVFAVPQYNHNKMRVCGYHILAELPTALANLVNGGQSISSDAEGGRLLNAVLRGHHIGITQHVEVGGHRGTNVTYTDVHVDSADDIPVYEGLGTAETLNLEEPIKAEQPVAAQIKATDLVKSSDEKVINNLMSTPVVEETPEVTSEEFKKPWPVVAKSQKKEAKTVISLADKAAALYEQMSNPTSETVKKAAAQGLRDLKSSSRKSWTYLGLKESTPAEIKAVLDVAPVPVEKVAKAKKAPIQVNSGDKEEALKLLKDERNFTHAQIAERTGLSKDQVYRLKKKLSV